MKTILNEEDLDLYGAILEVEYSDGTNKIDTNSKIYGAVWNDYAEYR